MEENLLERITKDKFEDIIYESQKILINEIEERKKLYYELEQMLDETQYYLDKGKRVKYFFNSKNGDLKYSFENKSIGFKK